MYDYITNKISSAEHVLKIKNKCCSSEWYDYIVHSTLWFYLGKDESKQANCRKYSEML